MEGACPAFSADEPLVRGLLGVVDCNLEDLIQTGYASLFQPAGALGPLLTAALTLYVALIGYRLLLGRSQLSIGEHAMAAVKLGAVVALATQWGTYQRLVYDTLFHGPEQLADIIARPLWGGAWPEGGVFDGLQRAFTDLTAFSPASPPGAAAVPGAGGAGQLSTLLSKAGFDSLLLLGSAVVLLISTLGVLLAAKIVLGLLLAAGPLFIALMLFEPTQGLFEGWLRAALAFAFAPLAVTLLLGFGLTLLRPSLDEIEAMRGADAYVPGVAFGAAVLTAVIAAVSLGMVAAGGLVAGGFRLRRPNRPRGAPLPAPAAAPIRAPDQAQTRAARTAMAVLAQTRRESGLAGRRGADIAALSGAASERRAAIGASDGPGGRAPPLDMRLGQQARRGAAPRPARSGPRAEAGR